MDIQGKLKNIDWKGIALQHCEKAAIAIVTCLLVLFLVKGVSKSLKARPVAPEEIEKLADQLERQIRESRWDESIAEREGVKNPDLQQKIDGLKSGVDEATYALGEKLFFRLEDFGGIFRNKPDIISPYDLIAVADRGAISLYQLDQKGEFKVEEIKLAELKKREDEAEEDKKKDEKKSKAKSQPKLTSRGRGGDRSSMMGDSSGMDMDGGDRFAMMSGRGGMGMRSGPSGPGGMPGGMPMPPGSGGMSRDRDMDMMRGMGGMGLAGDSDFGSSAGDMDDAGYGGSNLMQSQQKKTSKLDRRSKKTSRFYAPPVTDKAAPGKTPETLKIKKEEIRGVRWVVVTALLDHMDQVKKFNEALNTQVLGLPDEPPEYDHVRVERRYLTKDGVFSDWQQFDAKKAELIVKRIPATEDPRRREPENPEMLAAAAIFKNLVMPLPELVAGSWGSVDRDEAYEAAVKAGGAGAMAGRGDMDAADDDAGMTDEDRQSQAMSGLFGSDSGGMRYGYQRGGREEMDDAGALSGAMPGSSAGMATGRGNMAQGPMGAPGGMSFGSNMGGPMGGGRSMGGPMGGPMAGPMGGRGMMDMRGGAQTKGTASVPPPRKVQRSNAEVVQVRFIDYTVEPEHSYQYRFKVVVRNPNYKHRQVVEKVFARDELLESDEWSDPSTPVYIPADTEYFVLERVRQREEAKLQVHNWMLELGDWTLRDFSVRPGDPIGAKVREHQIVNWDGFFEKKDEYNFATDELLLDVSGGNKSFTFPIDGKDVQFTEPLPAEIFVIDRLGELIMRNEDLDKNDVARKDREKYLADLKSQAQKKDDKDKKGKSESGTSKDFDEDLPSRKGGSSKTGS